ncbi:SRPBCC domain-containing protein [Streptomyces olivochromogenes]|uniref:SRPBCC domain-containing protein n=1 Tax=Streptomyces olivochromogenes TaxID=1963 RepID=UPI001F288B46|nr:SRPBCC domain-containing protein [Streptomyces olivochromogenes]MCF3135670.1 carbon monoxide dehydrogenase [Streptomyces olivochromogenes]
MEHEVFVPVPAERLREALADPARVARAVPGLQQDAGAEPVAGRLKVRVGSHSVTYRGSLRVSARPDGTYAIEADATEARGTGSAALALSLRLDDTDDGSTATITGTATATGRVADLPPEAVTSAATRLLNRFVEGLAMPAEEAEESATPEQLEEGPEAEAEPETEVEAEAEGEADARASVSDAEIPPPSLDRSTDDDDDEGDVFGDSGEPPVEAAHARRTMIGRSAEEVDHAPPRGRYAPVPAPQTVAATSTLRWAAPAAALVLASAIVLGRALRRRR